MAVCELQIAFSFSIWSITFSQEELFSAALMVFSLRSKYFLKTMESDEFSLKIYIWYVAFVIFLARNSIE